MHLVVLYGYQGADLDAEQLALAEQLFDAAFGELSVVARGQPCLLVGDFNVEPTKIHCLAKGISAGLWVDLEGAWASAAGLQSSPTCKRDWGSPGGRRGDFMVGCLLAAAAVHSCRVQPDRWIAPHLAVRTLFDCCRWVSRVTQPVLRTPPWPASWLPAVDKGRSSKSVEVQRVWEVYDERLQFMSRQDALLLDEALGADDVCMAWAVWSRAAESALLDAYRFSGGPLPSRGMVLGRGSAMFRVVRLGGHPVRKARGNVADVHDAADVFLYRDASLAPLLDMRRRFKAVMDVLDAMIRSGISLSRSVELTAQWDKILALGPLYPVTLDDLHVVWGVGLGDFYHVVCDVHRRLSDFFVVWVLVSFFMLPLVSIVVLVTSFMLWLFADVMRRFGSGAIGFVPYHTAPRGQRKARASEARASTPPRSGRQFLLPSRSSSRSLAGSGPACCWSRRGLRRRFSGTSSSILRTLPPWCKFSMFLCRRREKSWRIS